MRLVLAALAVLALAACSKEDQHKTTQDIKATAGDLPGTVREGTNSSAGAEFQADIKALAKDTGKAVKEGAKETKHALDEQVQKEKK
jgi:uncharacterized lipoprotein